MKHTGKITMYSVTLLGVLLLSVGYICSCSRFQQQTVRKHAKKIKVVVVTGGHGFEKKPFFTMFDSFGDIEYTSVHLQDDSEIFEDISNWDYDVIVLYNMTQNISPKRQKNFVKLLRQGVGLVALHHSIGAFQQWGQYRKIIGAKYYLKDMVEGGVEHKASKYKEGLDINIHVKDKKHPITQTITDFTIHDETYKNQVFERDNHVLLTTDHPTSDKPVCWVRHYGRARVFYIQMGHGPGAYANANYRRLVIRAIKWCAGRLDDN